MKYVPTVFMFMRQILIFRSGIFYTINLGDEFNLPECDCSDWKRHLIPCKHMFAIFKFTTKSFNSLSKKYLNSPHLTIDFEEIGLNTTEKSAVKEENNNQDNNTVEMMPLPSTPANYKELPTSKFPKLSTGNKCREIMKEIKNLSYLMDQDDLSTMKLQLMDLLEFASSRVENDNGLAIEDIKSKKKQVNTVIKLPLLIKHILSFI